MLLLEKNVKNLPFCIAQYREQNIRSYKGAHIELIRVRCNGDQRLISLFAYQNIQGYMLNPYKIYAAKDVFIIRTMPWF